jgi:hypothetical protein
MPLHASWTRRIFSDTIKNGGTNAAVNKTALLQYNLPQLNYDKRFHAAQPIVATTRQISQTVPSINIP